MQLAHYLSLLERSCRDLGDALREVADRHRDEPDVWHLGNALAQDGDRHAESLRPFTERYGEDADDEPDRLHNDLFSGGRDGPLGLLRDLHDLYLMATECDITWTLVGQAAQGARGEELLGVVQDCEHETTIHLKWLKTRMKAAAPQVLVVA